MGGWEEQREEGPGVKGRERGEKKKVASCCLRLPPVPGPAPAPLLVQLLTQGREYWQRTLWDWASKLWGLK